MRHKLGLFMAGAALAASGFLSGLAAQEAGQQTAPDTVFLAGDRQAPVKFSHATHQEMAECTACHHESRLDVVLSQPYQSCTDCHTATPVAPITTTRRYAYHDRRAQTGVCMDCHVAEAAAGNPVPLKCPECHVKADPPPPPPAA